MAEIREYDYSTPIKAAETTIAKLTADLAEAQKQLAQAISDRDDYKRQWYHTSNELISKRQIVKQLQGELATLRPPSADPGKRE